MDPFALFPDPTVTVFRGGGPFDAAGLRINRVGCREAMLPGIVDRPQGTGDCLVMYFHTAVVIRDGAGAGVRPPGSLIVWEPGQGQYYGHPDAPWDHSWMHLEGAQVTRYLRSVDLPRGQVLPCGPEHVAPGLRAVLEELVHQARPDGIIISNLVENWVRAIARGVHGAGHGAIPPRLLALARELESAFAGRHSLDSLARRTNLSVSHFSALFRRHFGTPPMEYIIALRMNQALYLLRNRNLSIGEIAQRVGYPDLYYFSKLFKKRLGLPPRAMRRKLLGE